MVSVRKLHRPLCAALGWGAASVVLAVSGPTGCKCEAGPSGAASASASAGPVPAPAMPPTPRKPTTFSSDDGAALAGELLSPDDLGAPAVVLIHRHAGDRSEWAPLVERLAGADQRFRVLSFDLRGHGGSKAPPRSEGAPTPDDYLSDVRAAIGHVLASSNGKAKSVVLVGTSLGAALAAKMAWDEPKVTALALVSPGAAIERFDLYRPYAEVRNLPTFIAGAEEDTVSKEPLNALTKMAMSGTTKLYGGSMHSAAFLGHEHPELWQDLTTWLVTTAWNAALQERRSLYFAPGKEPHSKASATKPAAVGRRSGNAP